MIAKIQALTEKVRTIQNHAEHKLINSVKVQVTPKNQEFGNKNVLKSHLPFLKAGKKIADLGVGYSRILQTVDQSHEKSRSNSP